MKPEDIAEYIREVNRGGYFNVTLAYGPWQTVIKALEAFARPEDARTMGEALMRDCIGLRYFDQAIACTQGEYPEVAARLREWLGHARADLYEERVPQTREGK